MNEALRHRAELVESRIQLNSQELSNKALRSACCPRWTSSRTTAVLGVGGCSEPRKRLPGAQSSHSALRSILIQRSVISVDGD